MSIYGIQSYRAPGFSSRGVQQNEEAAAPAAVTSPSYSVGIRSLQNGYGDGSDDASSNGTSPDPFGGLPAGRQPALSIMSKLAPGPVGMAMDAVNAGLGMQAGKSQMDNAFGKGKMGPVEMIDSAFGTGFSPYSGGLGGYGDLGKGGYTGMMDFMDPGVMGVRGGYTRDKVRGKVDSMNAAGQNFDVSDQDLGGGQSQDASAEGMSQGVDNGDGTVSFGPDEAPSPTDSMSFDVTDNSTSSSSSSSGSSPCYITTATVGHLGKLDDCMELTVLRWFRDNILKTSDRGRDLIAQYYQTGPEIVSAINAHADKDQILTDIYKRFISPSVLATQTGAYVLAEVIYTNMVNYLQRKLGK